MTVQLDGAGRESDGDGPKAPGSEDASDAGAKESDGPVFVDESGRRRNRYRRLGIAVGTACAAYAAVIAGTLLSGNSDAPWLPVPMQMDEKPASEVDSPPLPDESADGTEPGERSDTAEGQVPGGGSGPVRTGESSSPDGRQTGGSAGNGKGEKGEKGEKPRASASAKPSEGPGTGVSPAPNPRPSASTKDPEPSASVSEPPVGGPSPSAPVSPTPSESSGPGPAPGSGSGSGPENVADGPPSPAPVETISPTPDAPSNPPSPQDSPSPENAA